MSLLSLSLVLHLVFVEKEADLQCEKNILLYFLFIFNPSPGSWDLIPVHGNGGKFYRIYICTELGIHPKKIHCKTARIHHLFLFFNKFMYFLLNKNVTLYDQIMNLLYV